MTEIKKDTKWKAGEESPNKNGSPPKRKRMRKSELRKLANKISKMEDKALQNLENSINGVDVDKQVLDSSKWALNSLVTISKAASAEEQGWIRSQKEMMAMDKLDGEDEEPSQSPEAIESELPKRLSLVYVAPEDDE